MKSSSAVEARQIRKRLESSKDEVRFGKDQYRSIPWLELRPLMDAILLSFCIVSFTAALDSIPLYTAMIRVSPKHYEKRRF